MPRQSSRFIRPKREIECVSPAEFIAAIAWPVVVLIIALLFRRALTDAFASATGKLAAGPFSLEWKRRITDVEGDLGLPPSISKGEIGGAAGKLDEIAQRSPTAAIVEAFAAVEPTLRGCLRKGGSRVSTPLGALDGSLKSREKKGL